MPGQPSESPASLPSARTQLWVAMTARQPSASSWLSAIRRGLLVALIAAIGAAVGEFSTAAIVAIGALNLGLVDAAVARRTLARTLLIAAVLCAFVAFFASLSSGTWWTVVLLVALAYVLGTIAGLGLTASTATFLTMVTAIIFTNDPGDVSGAARYALLVLIGGLLQAASSLLAWRYERDASLRRKLTLTIDALVGLAMSADSHHEFRFTATARELAAQQAIDAAHLPPDRRDEFDTLLTEINWARVCLSSWVTATDPSPADRQQVADRLRAAKRNLEHRPSSRGASDGLAYRPAATLEGPTGEALDEQLTTLERQTQHLADLGLTTPVAGSAPSTTSPTPSRTPTPAHSGASTAPEASTASGADYGLGPRARFHVLINVLRPGSSTFRQGLRLAVAIGVAQSLALILDLDRGYWLPLTVVMVVRPDFSTTLIRGALRVAGTVAAVVLVGTLLDATGNPEWLMVTLLVVFAPLVMRWISANYVFGSFAISATVLILLEAGEPAASTIEVRLINTLIGVAVAVVAYLLVPSWSGERLVPALLDMLETQRAWTNATIATLTGKPGPTSDLRTLGQHSRNAVLAVAPLIDKVALEPHRAQCNPQSAYALLTACHRAAIATFTLEVAARANSELVTSSALANTISDITTNFDIAAASLQHFTASVGSDEAKSEGPRDVPPDADAASTARLTETTSPTGPTPQTQEPVGRVDGGVTNTADTAQHG